MRPCRAFVDIRARPPNRGSSIASVTRTGVRAWPVRADAVTAQAASGRALVDVCTRAPRRWLGVARGAKADVAAYRVYAVRPRQAARGRGRALVHVRARATRQRRPVAGVAAALIRARGVRARGRVRAARAAGGALIYVRAGPAAAGSCSHEARHARARVAADRVRAARRARAAGTAQALVDVHAAARAGRVARRAVAGVRARSVRAGADRAAWVRRGGALVDVFAERAHRRGREVARATEAREGTGEIAARTGDAEAHDVALVDVRAVAVEARVACTTRHADALVGRAVAVVVDGVAGLGGARIHGVERVVAVRAAVASAVAAERRLKAVAVRICAVGRRVAVLVVEVTHLGRAGIAARVRVVAVVAAARRVGVTVAVRVGAYERVDFARVLRTSVFGRPVGSRRVLWSCVVRASVQRDPEVGLDGRRIVTAARRHDERERSKNGKARHCKAKRLEPLQAPCIGKRAHARRDPASSSTAADVKTSQRHEKRRALRRGSRRPGFGRDLSAAQRRSALTSRGGAGTVARRCWTI